MAERGKYSILAEIQKEIQKEQETAQPLAGLPVLLPEKRPLYTGKRSDTAYTQKGVFLKKESIERATQRLKTRGDKTDFSDLMQALLEAWLQTSE